MSPMASGPANPKSKPGPVGTGEGTLRLKWEAARLEAQLDSRRPPDDLPVFEELAELDAAPLQAAHRAALSPESALAEEFRVLRAKVRAIGEERAFRCIGIVSSSPAEGKTTVALGLASAMAHERDGRRVILVEADLRKRSIARYLGFTPASGLSEWLQADSASPVPVRRLGPGGPFLLTAGLNGPPNPEVLASRRVTRLFEACRRCFDFVVVDCPPLTPVADTVMLQELLDGFLLVVRARRTTRDALVRALSHLNRDRIQGVVFNDHEQILSGAYSYARSPYEYER